MEAIEELNLVPLRLSLEQEGKVNPLLDLIPLNTGEMKKMKLKCVKGKENPISLFKLKLKEQVELILVKLEVLIDKVMSMRKPGQVRLGSVAKEKLLHEVPPERKVV